MSRVWNAVLVAVIMASLAIQVTLLVQGGQDVNSGQSSAHVDLATRFSRFFSYFTIQSNLLVLVIAASLVLNPQREGHLWRVARLDSLLGIAITGLVFSVLLAGIVHHSGASAWANTGFHYFSPVWTLLGWAVFGPRPRVTWRVVRHAFLWPVAWIVFTLARGLATGWYPYPFLNIDTLGYARVALTVAAILLVALLLAAILMAVDRRLPGEARAA